MTTLNQTARVLSKTVSPRGFTSNRSKSHVSKAALDYFLQPSRLVPDGIVKESLLVFADCFLVGSQAGRAALQ
jgi:hypothetical protein